MSELDLAQPVFRKSSHSDGGNGCVEVAAAGVQFLVRDSKNPVGGFLAFSSEAWKAFLVEIKVASCDL